MKYLILFYAFISFHCVIAAETPEFIPQVSLQNSRLNDQLEKNQAQYIFEFVGLENQITTYKMQYSIDRKNSSQQLNDKNQLVINTAPGKHIFQFYCSQDYDEVYTDSLSIQPQFVQTYRVQLYDARVPVVVKKPVIYLYPDQTINFSVQIKPRGELFFTYPEYQSEWKGIAHTNGELEIHGNRYNYLFWESNQRITAEIIDFNSGFIVEGENVIPFLEEKLDQYGFKSTEKSDFITYWGPQMKKNQYNYVYFVLNREANYFAELDVNPKPDHVNRFYILTSPVDNPHDFYYLEPQLIEPALRNGFTLFEWGGSIIDINRLKNRL